MTDPLVDRLLHWHRNGYPPVLVLGPDAPATVERNGRTVRQTPGKQPHGKLWHYKDRLVYHATPQDIRGWSRLPDYREHSNAGIACGRVVVLDIDVHETPLAEQLKRDAIDELGATPLERVGESPKVALVYRSAGDPVRKVSTPELWKDGVKAQVEVLGLGQQFVAHGIHPNTKRSYQWGDATPENTPLSSLPAVTQEQVAAFVEKAATRLRAAGYRAKAEIEAGDASGETGPPKARTNGDRGESPFRAVNDEALRHVERWVRDLFPAARRSGNGAWRVSSADLGRDLEEDISVSPEGIVDFGVHDQGDPRKGKRTPIDLVEEWGGAPDPKAAALWLAERLGLEAEFTGKRNRPVTEDRTGWPEDLSAQNALSAQEGSNGPKPSGREGSDDLSALSALSAQGDSEPWPKPLGRAAYRGLVGRIVDKVAPQTEADPAALVFQLLAAFGNAVGAGPHFMVGKTRHRPGLFVLTAGATSRARKGTAGDVVRSVMELADEAWARDCLIRGDLSTGEGLIHMVRDPVERPVRDPQTKETRIEVVDPGVEDKRLFIDSAEFSGTLRMMAREGNSLSATVRQAWDRGDLRSTSKNNPSVATGAAVSISGHITLDELRREVTATEAASGFGNRFLYCCTRRARLLPDGGEDVDLSVEAGLLRQRLERVREAVRAAPDEKASRTVGRMTRDEEARQLWHRVYPRLAAERPGLLGALTARSEAQVLRLSMVYALMDGTDTIGRPHLEAALEGWRYAEASAAHVFGRALGDEVADTVLAALRRQPEGLSREAVRGLFSRHAEAARIDAAVKLLLRQGMMAVEEVRTGGRPRTVYRATPHPGLVPTHPPCAKSAESAERSEKPSNGAASEPLEGVCAESARSAERSSEPATLAGPSDLPCAESAESAERSEEPSNGAGSEPFDRSCAESARSAESPADEVSPLDDAQAVDLADEPL